MNASKTNRHELDPQRPGRKLGFFAAACLTSTLAFTAGALAEGTSVGNGNAGNPGFAPGDLVGTLPAYYGGSGPAGAVNNPEVSSDKAVAQPSFVLVGTGAALVNVIESATGDGFVSIYVQPESGLQGLVFHGDVTIELDRLVLMRETLETSLWIGPDFGDAFGIVSLENRFGSPFHVAQGEKVDLPLAGLAASRILDQFPVSLDLVNYGGKKAGLEVQAFHGVIQVSQAIPD